MEIAKLITEIKQSHKLFSNRFPEHSPHLPLVGQTDCPTPNSHHWLRRSGCTQPHLEMAKY